MTHDRIVNQHQPGIALYPRNLSYDLLPLIGPAGWSLLRALHDHADEQAIRYRGARPIAPSAAEMEALAGAGEATLLVIKELLRVCGCLSWDDVRGKQEPRPGRRLKQAPTRSLVYYLHPLNGLDITQHLVRSVLSYADRSERAQAYLKANGLLRPKPAYLPTSVWPSLLPWLVEDTAWQALFQRLHGPDAHLRYREQTLRWLEGAAEVVATLEWEQQPLHERECITVHRRAVMVMERWFGGATVPSWRLDAPPMASHHDSPSAPHTPVNESINQPIGGEPGGPVLRVEEPEAPAQAEAALWAAVRVILNLADDHGPSPADPTATPRPAPRTPHPPSYQPSRSERRQARRLLHAHPVEDVLDALRAAVRAYAPTPGQPPTITRFGFAVGLPAFKKALGEARVPDLQLPTPKPGPLESSTPNPQPPPPIEEDFWHEYRRINGDRITRAERRRIETIAVDAGWPRLLVWLDRWERAHGDSDDTLGPGYFQVCADAEAWREQGTGNREQGTRDREHGTGNASWKPGDGLAVAPDSLPASRTAATTDPPTAERAPVPALSDSQQAALSQLAALGIRKAHWLAGLPTTTPDLVDAWRHEAAHRHGLKDPRAFIAVGVGTGQPPALAALHTATSPTPSPHPPTPTSELWRNALARLQRQVPADSYATWLSTTELLDIIDDTAIIGTPNVFVRDEVAARYRDDIAAALEQALGKPLAVEIVIGTAAIA